MDGTSDLSGSGQAPYPSIATALLGFTHRLREVGIPVSMVETLDCTEAIGAIDPFDRSVFKATLATTLVKRAEHTRTFDSLFESWFAAASGPGEVETSLDRAAAAAEGEAGAGVEQPGEASTDLLALLVEALRSDEIDALRLLAEVAVAQYGGLDTSGSTSERYYIYRVLRQLELAELLQRAMALERAESSGPLSALDERLLRDAHLARMEELRRAIAAEIRRQLASPDRDVAGISTFRDKPIEDVDLLEASPTELREIREAIRPLAQKLVARIARRRRLRRRGRLDVRRTLRRSLSAGGVPLEPVFRRPRASKPEIYLLCDISGSVSEFARFTMSLLHAVKAEFSDIRLFAFVDGIDEVTDLMEGTGHELAPRNLLYGTKVIAADGHSDYGSVFRRFWNVYGYGDLDQRATVIITGDARNNFRDPGSDAFQAIADRARYVYWLNPEPKSDWNTGDSLIDVYAGLCSEVRETRNLRQLMDFVSGIS